MTRQESAIVGAYTGYLCGPFSAMHEYIEKIMGRPVWTHEMANPGIVKAIQRASRVDFVALANSVEQTPDEKAIAFDQSELGQTRVFGA